MTTIFYNISTYSRFNLSESESDIRVFVKEYRERIKKEYTLNEENESSPFTSFASPTKFTYTDDSWLQDNHERFFKDSPNEWVSKLDYLSELGFITAIIFSPDGEYLIVGHSTGLIQMRNGKTGTVLATLRNIQFPPKPVYALQYSRNEERVCYASSADGTVYRIDIPNLFVPVEDLPELCIRADPALDHLNTQFYGSPGPASHGSPFIFRMSVFFCTVSIGQVQLAEQERSPALSFGTTADSTKMIVGYADTSIRIFDMETQEIDMTYKVHRLRLQFIPKKLQRIHFGQVCALRCHDQNPNIFASGAWDNTLRIWDVRCQVGCMMTFEGVNICHDSIDLNRNQCISGSWDPTEALSVWDLTARKRISIVRVQNRRPDVDGEYIYACRYWKSPDFNRKGKYAIIGGSGTKCVEVINLHNRYITCSYPAAGTVVAVASHHDRIAFGGTAPVFNIVSFHDPKHEKYLPDQEPEFFDYSNAACMLFDLNPSGRPSDPIIATDVSRKDPFEDEVVLKEHHVFTC